MIIHRSLKVQDDLWHKMEGKARDRGFKSTNAYIRYIIEEDIGAGTLEETEERIVSTISKVAAKAEGLSTMHQVSFASLWALLEMFVGQFPPGQAEHLREQRLQDLRARIAGDVRGDSFMEFQNGASKLKQ